MKDRLIGDLFSEWEIMFNIHSARFKSSFSISDLAKDIEIDRFHPTFNRVMKSLIDQEIIIVSEIVGRSKLLKIEYNKLENYLRKRKPFLIIDAFIHKNTKPLAVT